MNVPEPQTEKKMGRTMLTISWVIALAGLTYFFGTWEKDQYNPNRAIQSANHSGTVEIQLKRNRHNHYVATGLVNNQKVVFLLDTGATHVSVPDAIANKLGLVRGTQSLAITANGTVKTWQTRIDTLQLGDITLRNVSASINPGMQTEEILLGMSALKQLEFTQRGDVLTIKQY